MIIQIRYVKEMVLRFHCEEVPGSKHKLTLDLYHSVKISLE